MLDQLRFDPNASVKSKIQVAEAFVRIGRSSDAEVMFNQLRFDLDASVESKIQVAEAFDRMGRSHEAQAMLDQLRFDPDASVKSKIQVAEAFVRIGRSSDAEVMFDQLRFDLDASVESKILVAEAFNRVGRLDEANTILDQLRFEAAGTRPTHLRRDDHLATSDDDNKNGPSANVPVQDSTGNEVERTQSTPVESRTDIGTSAQQPLITRGRTFSFHRTATEEELCLEVQTYATVLARLFRLPDPGDFCVAIFGFWGRGKTFLLEQTAKVINVGFTAETEGYETIFFSAWKYPSRPEVWIHLYETVFQRLRNVGWWKSLAYVIRAGIVRHRKTRLFMIWGALMFSALPKGGMIKGIETYFRGLEWSVALGAVIFCVIFAWKLWKTTFVLEHGFFKAPRHSEKLGLQATILPRY
ncbi:MAG: hypothetical protein QOK24_1363 [Verrucomicrobiota bacterium]